MTSRSGPAGPAHANSRDLQTRTRPPSSVGRGAVGRLPRAECLDELRPNPVGKTGETAFFDFDPIPPPTPPRNHHTCPSRRGGGIGGQGRSQPPSHGPWTSVSKPRGRRASRSWLSGCEKAACPDLAVVEVQKGLFKGQSACRRARYTPTSLIFTGPRHRHTPEALGVDVGNWPVSWVLGVVRPDHQPTKRRLSAITSTRNVTASWL